MSDRRADQGQPLFPRRTLSGPGAAPDTTPAPAGREVRRRPRPRRTRIAGEDGSPTEAMSRVDRAREQTGDQTRDQVADGYAPRPAPPGAAGPAGTAPRSASTTQELQPSARPAGTPPAGSAAAGPAAAGPATTGPAAATRPRRGPRKARLRIVRLDPWSVMKMALALSIALAIVMIIAVAIVWSVLDAAGVWQSINTSVDTIVNSEASDEFDVQNYVGFTRVLGLTMVVSMANVVLLTALATLAAFMYNLAAALLGGFEVTLAEDR